MSHGMHGHTGALVCAILEMVYVDKNAWFQNEAARRGITLEQLTAAAITEAMHEQEMQCECRCARKYQHVAAGCGRAQTRNTP